MCYNLRMGNIVLPIAAGIREIDIGWIKIAFSEALSRLKVTEGPFEEMTAAATKEMWVHVDPGHEKYKQRKKEEPGYHPKNYSPPSEPIPLEDAPMWSSCGAIYSLTGLILANSGIPNLSLLRCRVKTGDKEAEGHVTLMLGPGAREEFSQGALLNIDRKGLPHWTALANGDMKRYLGIVQKRGGLGRPVFDMLKGGELIELLDWED